MQPWTLQIESQVEKLEHFRYILLLFVLNHSFPFLIVTRIGLADVVKEPIDDEQAEMPHMTPADFCGFGLEHSVPIHPVF